MHNSHQQASLAFRVQSAHLVKVTNQEVAGRLQIERALRLCGRVNDTMLNL